MELSISKRFKKQAKKLVENKVFMKQKLPLVLHEFSNKGKKASCYRKALKGKWHGHDELQVGGDIRIIVRISEKENRAVLEQIGTHAQLAL